MLLLLLLLYILCVPHFFSVNFGSTSSIVSFSSGNSVIQRWRITLFHWVQEHTNIFYSMLACSSFVRTYVRSVGWSIDTPSSCRQIYERTYKYVICNILCLTRSFTYLLLTWFAHLCSPRTVTHTNTVNIIKIYFLFDLIWFDLIFFFSSSSFHSWFVDVVSHPHMCVMCCDYYLFCMLVCVCMKFIEL